MQITFYMSDKQLLDILNEYKLPNEPSLGMNEIKRVASHLENELSVLAHSLVVAHIGDDEGALMESVMESLEWPDEPEEDWEDIVWPKEQMTDAQYEELLNELSDPDNECP